MGFWGAGSFPLYFAYCWTLPESLFRAGRGRKTMKGHAWKMEAALKVAYISSNSREARRVSLVIAPKETRKLVWWAADQAQPPGPLLHFLLIILESKPGQRMWMGGLALPLSSWETPLNRGREPGGFEMFSLLVSFWWFEISSSKRCGFRPFLLANEYSNPTTNKVENSA